MGVEGGKREGGELLEDVHVSGIFFSHCTSKHLVVLVESGTSRVSGFYYVHGCRAVCLLHATPS